MLRPVTSLMEYVVNYDYISNALCVNKDNVEMNCNGKCYLSKKLEKEKDKSIKISKKDYPIFFVKVLNYYYKKNSVIKIGEIFFYQRKYTFIFYNLIFQPPIFI